MKVLRPDITNRGMETPEAADFPKITLVVAWPVSVPAVSPSPPPPPGVTTMGEARRD